MLIAMDVAEIALPDAHTLFRRTLAVGSTRVKIYDSMVAQAQKDSRLPFQAQAVYDEILAKMKSVLRESKLTKQTRIEMEFNQLELVAYPIRPF